MAGTRKGGLKATTTMKIKYGKDFYKRIGKLGGKGDNGGAKNKGFASMPYEVVRALGIKGGVKGTRSRLNK